MEWMWRRFSSWRAQGRCRLFVHGAGLDIVHSPRATYWKSVGQRLATATAATSTIATATAADPTTTTATAATPTTAAATASAAATGCASTGPLHSAQMHSPVQMHFPVQMQSPRRAPAVRYTYLAGRTHWDVCSDLYGLGLHEDEELWHDRAAPERSRL